MSRSRSAKTLGLILAALCSVVWSSSASAQSVLTNVPAVELRGRQAETSYAFVVVENAAPGSQFLRLVSHGWLEAEAEAFVAVAPGEQRTLSFRVACPADQDLDPNVRTASIEVDLDGDLATPGDRTVEATFQVTADCSAPPTGYAPNPAQAICNRGDAIAAPPGLYHNASNLPDVTAQSRVELFVRNDETNCGGNLIVPWSKIAPTEGVFDWEWLRDQADLFWRADAATGYAGGKRVNLLFWPAAQQESQEFLQDGVAYQPFATNVLDGFAVVQADREPATPAWVRNATTMADCDGSNGLAFRNTRIETPVQIDPSFQRAWLDFVTAAMKTVQYDAGVGYVRFGAGVGAENYPGNRYAVDPVCVASYQSVLAARQAAEPGLDFGTAWTTWTEDVIRTAALARAADSSVAIFTTLNDAKDPSDVVIPGFAAAIAAYAGGLGVNVGSQGLSQAAIAQVQNGQVCAPDWCGLFATSPAIAPFNELQTNKSTVRCLSDFDADAAIAEQAATGTPYRLLPLDVTNPDRDPGCEPNQPSGYLPQLLPFAIDNGGLVFELYWQEWQGGQLDADYATALEDAANELAAVPEPGAALVPGAGALLGIAARRARRRPR